jgi:hypothetical protein
VGGDEKVEPGKDDKITIVTTGSPTDPERIRREEGERQREEGNSRA